MATAFEFSFWDSRDEFPRERASIIQEPTKKQANKVFWKWQSGNEVYIHVTTVKKITVN